MFNINDYVFDFYKIFIYFSMFCVSIFSVLTVFKVITGDTYKDLIIKFFGVLSDFFKAIFSIFSSSDKR